MMPLALRYAWRELRGGLRGFGVFVACIALGVMAIAGVGSVAQSLADGLSRAGGVILGGDLAFSLVQREANDSERSFLGAHGALSVAGTLPTMARASDGRTTLVEIKAVDDAYPLLGAVATDPDMLLPALFARVGDVFGAAADPALLDTPRSQARRPHHHRQSGNRAARGAAKRAGPIGRRDQFRAALADEPGSVARQRAAAARQSGAMAISVAAAYREFERQRRRRRRTGGAYRIPECRLGRPHPQEGFAAARAQRRAFQPISHARRLDRAAGRRRRGRQRGGKPLSTQARCDRHNESTGRHRRRHFRHLLLADHAGRAVRDADRAPPSARPCHS